MRSTFQPLMENLTCELCHSGLEKRVNEIVDQWASVKVSDIVLIFVLVLV
jgi:hypothetical protein